VAKPADRTVLYLAGREESFWDRGGGDCGKDEERTGDKGGFWVEAAWERRFYRAGWIAGER